MRFEKGLAFVFTESWAFVRLAWWLALLPTVPRFASSVGAGLVGDGLAAVLDWVVPAATAVLSTALTYCIVRFVALGRDLRGAIEVNRDSARTFAPFLVSIAFLAFAPERAFALLDLESLGLGIALFTLGIALFTNVLFAAWTVTAPSGGTVIGPIASSRLVLRCLVWAVLLVLAVWFVLAVLFGAFALVLPTGFFRSAVEGLSVGQPTAASAAMATLTALVSGYVGVAFVVASYVIAHKAGVRVSSAPTLASVFE